MIVLQMAKRTSLIFPITSWTSRSRRRENMVGVNMVLAESVRFKHGLYKSCGIECFEGIMLEPCFLHVFTSPVMVLRHKRTCCHRVSLSETTRNEEAIYCRSLQHVAIMWPDFATRPHESTYTCIHVYTCCVCIYIYIYIYMYTHT